MDLAVGPTNPHDPADLVGLDRTLIFYSLILFLDLAIQPGHAGVWGTGASGLWVHLL